MTHYRVSPGVRWCVERVSVIVTDGKGQMLTLVYPEAAVWDLFSRGYPFSRVVSMTAHIASLDPDAADALVRTTVEEWAARGFVERQ
jgi:hypothetical protein